MWQHDPPDHHKAGDNQQDIEWLRPLAA